MGHCTVTKSRVSVAVMWNGTRGFRERQGLAAALILTVYNCAASEACNSKNSGFLINRTRLHFTGFDFESNIKVINKKAINKT